MAYAQVGSPAVIRLGDGDTQAQGTISWVGLEADVMTGKFKVEVEVPTPTCACAAGSSGAHASARTSAGMWSACPARPSWRGATGWKSS